MERGKQTKSKALFYAYRYLLLIFGCALLAIGDVGFISPFNLVTGGVFSIAIIIQHFVTASGIDFYVIDLVTWALQVLLLVLSFMFLGKTFTMRSIFATLLYPALVSLFSRLPIINGLPLGTYIGNQFINAGIDWGVKTLAGLAGGALVGSGVAVCYLAGGSTGGLDILSAIIAKHTPIKEAVSSFVIDGFLVVVGIFVFHSWVSGVIGILSAFACALAVQYIYVNGNAFVIADIISSEHEAIRKHVEEQMDRTTTIINVKGGYTGNDRVLLRVAFSKKELPAFRSFIAEVDPSAFVTFTQASMINGEGFDPLVSKSFNKKKNDSKNEDLHG